MALFNTLVLAALFAVGCIMVAGQGTTEERVPRGLIVSRGIMAPGFDARASAVTTTNISNDLSPHACSRSNRCRTT